MSKLTLKPTEGGDLITTLSTNEAGAANYTEKRNWRRDFEQERRREGDEYFEPLGASPSDQSHPAMNVLVFGTEPILQFFTARADNGLTALIALGARRIWRFIGTEQNAIIAADIVQPPVFGGDPTIIGTIGNGAAWLLIGSGFNGGDFSATEDSYARWQCRNVGGVAIFNNGRDLPVSYKINEFAVRPIHELREQGVGTAAHIEETNGVLVLANIVQIQAEYLPTMLTSGYFGPVPASSENASKVSYLVLWGDPVGARRWGAAAKAAMVQGERTVTLENPLVSVSNGDSVRIVGAGLNGGDLITQFIRFISPTQALVYDRALTTVAITATAEIAAGSFALADAATLTTGSSQLLDDSTAILGVVKHKDRTVFAKESGFIVGAYTGAAGQPFEFERVYTGKDSLYWSNTLIEVDGDRLLYAGRETFFDFDLVSRRPRENAKLALCNKIFFDAVAAEGYSQNLIWAADNGKTKEIWIGWKGAIGATDRLLCLDYRGNSVSTSDADYACMATVDLPTNNPRDAATKIVMMGLRNGRVLRDSAGTTRRGVDTISAITAGLTDFGDNLNEKHLKQYLLLLASQSAGAVTVDFFGTRNVDDTIGALGTQVFATPATQNTVFMHFLAHLMYERITATGASNARLSARVWIFNKQGGSSAIRR